MTSVGLSLPSPFTVSGSPVTSTGTLTGTLTGILGSANGGTANGFFAVSGPATSTRTFTFPNADATVLTSNAAVTVGQGGTGNTTFTAYSILAAGTTATGAFQNVSGVGTSGQVLTSNGAGALPTWQAAAGGVTGTTGTIDLFPGGFAPDGTGTGNNAATLQLDISTGTQTTNTPKAGENVLLFDSATDEHWLFVKQLPTDYVSGGTLRGVVKSAATSGNFIMKAGQVCTTDGTTNSNTAVFTAADLSSATAVNGTAGVTVAFSITLTTTGMAANRKCVFFIGRDADNSSDTVNSNDIALISLNLDYTR